MTPQGYRWEPGTGLYAVEGDRVVDVLSTSADRRTVARRILEAAEATRSVRARPPRMLDRMAEAFARDRLEREGPVTLTVEEVLAWVDGPGLDVILAYVLAHRGR